MITTKDPYPRFQSSRPPFAGRRTSSFPPPPSVRKTSERDTLPGIQSPPDLSIFVTKSEESGKLLAFGILVSATMHVLILLAAYGYV